MIGKPEWFARRKYGGWGLTPKTWQGWVYIAVIMLPLIIFHSLPFWTDMIRIYVTLVWVAFLLVDVTDIMMHLRVDEREDRIESLSERNAAYAMIAVIIIGILYDVFRSASAQQVQFNPFLFAALIGGAAVKSISNIIYERRSL